MGRVTASTTTDRLELRLVGGAMSAQALADLALIAGDHGDGHLHLTERATIELRGIDAVKVARLLPPPLHEHAPTIMVSPLSGRLGGQADLRPVGRQLDELLCSDDTFADLPAGFTFVLDDGRGDLVDRGVDVGVMAVESGAAQVRVGSMFWGEVVPLDDVPEVLLDLARRFMDSFGTGGAPAHVDDMDDHGETLLSLNHARDLRTQVTSLPAPFVAMVQDDGRRIEHVEVPDGDLTHDRATQVLARAGRDVVVTPWRSVLLPDLVAADRESR